MTYRDFLNSVISTVDNEELKVFAKAELAKLDNRNAKRRDTLTKEQKENEAIKAEIVEKVTASAVASAIGKMVGISTQKASALMRQLVSEGKFTVAELKVKGKGSVLAYTPATEG